jgi:thiosulfate dehydrogenase [quinone] large subunit
MRFIQFKIIFMASKRITYQLARLPIGFSLLGHGLVRLPKLSAFANGMVANFSDSPLPQLLVKPFAFSLPFIELLIGVGVILGFQIRAVSVAGVMLMCVLIFGSSFIESWNAIAIQMFYGVYFALLFRFSHFNTIGFTLKK